MRRLITYITTTRMFYLRVMVINVACGNKRELIGHYICDMENVRAISHRFNRLKNATVFCKELILCLIGRRSTMRIDES